MINFVTVKWGNKFTHEHVNRLYNMVSKNYRGDFGFWCFTDNFHGINKNIAMVPLANDLEGVWNKLWVLPFDLGARENVFLDLDIVIQRDCTEFFHSGKAGLSVLDAEWKTMDVFDGSDMHNNSSVMMWYNQSVNHIYHHFMEDPEYYMLKYQGIDRYMYHENIEFSFLPTGYVYSRLFGFEKGKPGNEPHHYNKEWGMHRYPDKHICIFNSWNKEIDYSNGYLIDDRSYEGYEHYWDI